MKPLALKELVEERKEKAIETLSDSYAKNKLPLEEYERLVEYINKIESERELIVVEKIVAEYDSGYGDNREKEPEEFSDDDDYDDQPAFYRNQSNLTNNLAILSSRTYQGPIKPESQFLSILGSTKIKVRKEDLVKKKTVLNLVSILGDNIIYVEPGIKIINRVIPILGSAQVSKSITKPASSGAPELVISGMALLGDISVKLLKD